jgi:hypothetical protein
MPRKVRVHAIIRANIVKQLFKKLSLLAQKVMIKIYKLQMYLLFYKLVGVKFELSKDGQRLRLPRNSVLRRVFGSERGKVTGGW